MTKPSPPGRSRATRSAIRSACPTGRVRIRHCSTAATTLVLVTDQQQADTGARTIRPRRGVAEREGEYQDIRYETADPFAEGAGGGRIAKITIDRPEVRNAFRPATVMELSEAFTVAREDPEVGVVVLTGEGPIAFCSGGDQRSAATRATSVRTRGSRASAGSTSPTSMCRSAGCPSRWWPWSPATRSAAVTCCT